MDEQQRELATHRLLEIIRGKGAGAGKGQETTPPPSASPQTATAPPPAPPSRPIVPTSLPEVAPARPPTVSGSEMIQRAAQKSDVAAPAAPPPAVKKPGMGLLEKVLVKQAAPSAEAPLPPQKPRPEAAPSPSEAPSPPPSGKAETPVEGKPLAPADLPPDFPIPDSLLPLSTRLKRSLKRAFAPKPPKLKAPSQAKPTAAKEKPAPAPKAKKASRAPSVGKKVYALDIGVASVKVVELIKHGTRYSIFSLQSRVIPPAMRKNAASLPMLQAKLIRELLPPEIVKASDLFLLISDKGAQARSLSIPGGTPKELINAIKFQIKKDLPFPLDVCEISYRGYNPKAPGKQDLEILAADKRAYETPIAALDEIGLLPSLVTSSPASLRFLIQDYTGIAPGPGGVVIADIGASKTTITIVDSDRVVLSRTISTGGDDFTDVLTGVPLGPGGEELTDIQAERYKMDFGLPSEREPGMMKAAILMRPIAERISTELNRSLDFYRRERPGGEIKKVMLGGGGALLKRLPEFLAENTGAEITLGSPTARISLAPGVSDEIEIAATEGGPIFLPALAVALSDAKELNLLPANTRNALKLRKLRGVIAPAALGFTALLIALYTIALMERGSNEQEFAKIKQQLHDLDQWRAKSAASEALFAKLTAELADRQADYDSIRIGEPEIPRYLKAISNLTPENLYLEKIETKFLSETDSAATAAAAAAANPAGAQNGMVSMETVLQNFTKSFGDPFAAGKDAAAQAPPVKRPIYGRVMELTGSLYPHGTLTDVQLVDFVFSLENSGHFRDVAVDSMAVESSGKVFFRILCGI